MNYLFLLPEELIDIIFEKCVEKSVNNSPLDVFIKFKYRIHSLSNISCTYLEYTGMINNGLLDHNSEIISCTSYLENIPSFLLKQTKPNHQTIFETIWLYRPLFYVFPRSAKYKPIFIS